MMDTRTIRIVSVVGAAIAAAGMLAMTAPAPATASTHVQDSNFSDDQLRSRTARQGYARPNAAEGGGLPTEMPAGKNAGGRPEDAALPRETDTGFDDEALNERLEKGTAAGDQM